jgi:hypothetical protein
MGAFPALASQEGRVVRLATRHKGTYKLFKAPVIALFLRLTCDEKPPQIQAVEFQDVAFAIGGNPVDLARRSLHTRGSS